MMIDDKELTAVIEGQYGILAGMGLLNAVILGSYIFFGKWILAIQILFYYNFIVFILFFYIVFRGVRKRQSWQHQKQ